MLLLILQTNISRCSYLRKGDTLRWTAYSDECLRIIETQKECVSDALLVQLVKLRLISENVTNAPWSSAMVEREHVMRPPATFYLKSLEVQLHQFKSNVPSDLLDNSESPFNAIISMVLLICCIRNLANGTPYHGA